MTKEEQAQEIINTSGNNFHYKVVDYFRSNGWEVMVSPYYTDNFSEKPREIDLLAEKDTILKDSLFGRSIGYVRVKLFIECKYLNNETVFWFDDRDLARATEKVISTTPLEDPKHFSMTNKHRYLSNDEVAKVFASSKSADNDVFYKASTQCLNALVGNFRQPSIIKNSPKLTSYAVLNYPVIVCNSYERLFKASKGKPEQVAHKFQLEMNYAYIDYASKKTREYFLIDIVDFDQIPTLILEIEAKDIAAINEKVEWDGDQNSSSESNNLNLTV